MEKNRDSAPVSDVSCIVSSGMGKSRCPGTPPVSDVSGSNPPPLSSPGIFNDSEQLGQRFNA